MFPAGGEDDYPDGCELTETLASFCGKVESEATQEEFEEQMAEWRKDIEEELREEEAHTSAPTEPSEKPPTAPSAQTEAQPEFEPESESESESESETDPDVMDRSSDSPPPSKLGEVVARVLSGTEDYADALRGRFSDDEWDGFTETISDSQAKAYESFLKTVDNDHRFAAAIAIAAYLVENPMTEDEPDEERSGKFEEDDEVVAKLVLCE